MSLQDVYSLNRALYLTGLAHVLDVHHSIDDNIGKELALGSKKLGRHGGLSGVNKGIAAKSVNFQTHVLLNELDGLSEGNTVTRHHTGRVDLVLNKLVGSLEELSSEDNDGGSTITDLSVLDLGKFDEYLSSGMLDFQLLKDGGTVICNGNITNIVDEHLVETLRTKRALYDVGERLDSHNYSFISFHNPYCWLI